MNASPFEWIFFGGPVELMIGLPILIGIVSVVFALIKAGFDALTGRNDS